MKHLTDFGRIFKNISWMYLNISQIWSESKILENLLKTAMFRPNPKVGYQGLLYTGYYEWLVTFGFKAQIALRPTYLLLISPS